MIFFVLFFLLVNLLYLAYNLGYVFAFSKRLSTGFTHLKYTLFNMLGYLINQFLFMEDNVDQHRRLRVEHRNEYVSGRNFFIFRTINFLALFMVIIDIIINYRSVMDSLIIIIIIIGLFLLQYILYHLVYVEDEPYKNIFIVTTLIQYSLYLSYALILPKLMDYWGVNNIILFYNSILLITSIFNYILITIITIKILFQHSLFDSTKKIGANILSFAFLWITNILSGAITYDAVSNLSTSQLSTIGNGFDFIIEYYYRILAGFSDSFSIVFSSSPYVDKLLALIPIPNLIILFIFIGRLFDLIIKDKKAPTKKMISTEFHKTDVTDYHETYFIN